MWLASGSCKVCLVSQWYDDSMAIPVDSVAFSVDSYDALCTLPRCVSLCSRALGDNGLRLALRVALVFLRGVHRSSLFVVMTWLWAANVFDFDDFDDSDVCFFNIFAFEPG